MLTEVITAPGSVARDALVATVREVQADDVLAPVTVVVESPYAGISLRRHLGADGGVGNIRFVSVDGLAARVDPLPARPPLSAAVAHEATRLALADAELTNLEATTPTVDAVVATMREADAAGVALSSDLERVRELVRDRTRGAVDREDRLVDAANVVGRQGIDGELGAVVWFLPGQPTPGARRLIDALSNVTSVRVIALTDETPLGTTIVSASDADTEARAVVAQIIELAGAGHALARIGISYTTASPYHRLLHERLVASGIPVAGPTPRRLRETAPGRVLDAWIRLTEEGWSRDAVIRLLTAGTRDGRAVTWDAISRSAGIVGGLDQWRTRLDAYAGRHADDERSGPTSELRALVDELAALAAADSWSTAADHARSVLDRLFGSIAGPEAEVDARRAIDDALAGLSPLDALGSAPRSFADAVTRLLDAPAGRSGAMGSGVLLAPLPLLVGTDLDVVFVVGLAEGAAPGVRGEDPLLPGQGLAERRRTRDRMAYLGALAAAPDRRLSFARADLRAGRRQLPSTWMLETAAALARRPVRVEELLEGGSSWPWLRVIASLEHLVASDPLPGPQEARLRWLAAGEPSVDVAAGYEAISARASNTAGVWDGVLGALDGLAPSDEHPFSATRLEVWAKCSFRYFLSTVLGLRDLERPEERDRIDPRVQGVLLHDVLEEFVRAHLGKAPDEAWTDAERAELLDILDRRAGDAAARGLVGRRNLWALDQRRLRAQARDFLDVDDVRRDNRGMSPWRTEIGFDEGDELPALDVVLHGQRVRFRGRIDRIDRSADGTRIALYDYKTGRAPKKPQLADDRVAAGTMLQPALYASAAAAATPDADVAFQYWYTREPNFEEVFELDEDAKARLYQVLELVVGAISAGQFARDPGPDNAVKGPEHCRNCDFTRICPIDRVATAQRRHADPASAVLRKLRAEDTP